MNSNVKEIGHVSFKIFDEKPFRHFYEDVLCLKTGFVLKTSDGKDRIVYYQLNRGQFLEVFPKVNPGDWPEYEGHSNEDILSYQYTTIGTGNEPKKIQDPEGNTFKIHEGEKFISKITYHVRDLDKSKKFYQEVLNLDILEENPNKVQVAINDFQIIELLKYSYAGDNRTDNKGFCHYALIVNDIEKEAKRFEQLGYLMTNGPKNMNNWYSKEHPYQAVKHSEKSYNFYIQDPDDNEIEIMAYSDESYQVQYAAK